MGCVDLQATYINCAGFFSPDVVFFPSFLVVIDSADVLLLSVVARAEVIFFQNVCFTGTSWFRLQYIFFLSSFVVLFILQVFSYFFRGGCRIYGRYLTIEV